MSLRPLASGLAAILVVYAYLASGEPINILNCVCVFVLTGTIMAWNDWCDRHHDAKLGKSFALTQGATYFWYCIGLWAITFVLIGITATQHWQSGVLGLGIALAGLVYTYSRNIIILPEVMCAICLTAVMFYPMIEGHSGPVWYLYLFVGIGNLARENLKNTDHPEADVGWKKTLSVFFGNRTAVIVARFMLAITVMMGLLVAAHASSTYLADIQVGGMLVTAMAGYYLLSNWFPVARHGLDIAALIFLTGVMWHAKTPATTLVAMGSTPNYLPKDGATSQLGFPEWQPQRVTQPKWIWPVMILSLFVVVSGLRLITATAHAMRIFLPGTFGEAVVTGIVVVALFLILFYVPFFAPAFDDSEKSETRGYRIVKRMSGGLLLGAVCGVVGGSTWLVSLAMFGICAVSIIWYPTACWVLKQRGFQLGAIIGLALIGGIEYATLQFLCALIPVGIFYYLYAWSHKPGIPSAIPSR